MSTTVVNYRNTEYNFAVATLFNRCVSLADSTCAQTIYPILPNPWGARATGATALGRSGPSRASKTEDVPIENGLFLSFSFGPE